MGFSVKNADVLGMEINMRSTGNKNINSEEIDFFNWLDEILLRKLPNNIKAINFNLYEDYDNGIIIAYASHDYSMGNGFAPSTLYGYNEKNDEYEQIGYVETWSKEVSDSYMAGACEIEIEYRTLEQYLKNPIDK